MVPQVLTAKKIDTYVEANSWLPPDFCASSTTSASPITLQNAIAVYITISVNIASQIAFTRNAKTRNPKAPIRPNKPR